jgi:glutamate formiminotransferase
VIECVPNFSEGQDLAKIQEIVRAMGSTPGVFVLGWEADADHNRSVVTIAGPPESVVEAAIAGVGRAADLIDLRQHQGRHPRVGAADVVPFIPLNGEETMEDCARAAHQAGREIWRRFGVPVYYYELAARTPNRKRLEKTRRAEFDGQPPDEGNITAHETAGASMLGARGILIAYNVDLETKDPAVAQTIAKKIRESSGGFAHVKAMGLYLPARDCAQVSMNLVHWQDTPLMDLLATIDRLAVELGTKAGSGELIGFVPRAAYDAAPEFFKRAGNFELSRVIENRIAELTAATR